MDTTGIIVLIVIVVLALIVIGFIASSMKKRNKADDEARAAHLRREADERASATLPDAEVQAKRAEVEAEEARLEAERLEQRATEARTGVVQQEAEHEDKLRAADRLDPNVDHKADDYTPTSTTPDGTARASDHDPDTILDDDTSANPDTTDGTTRT